MLASLLNMTKYFLVFFFASIFYGAIFYWLLQYDYIRDNPEVFIPSALIVFALSYLGLLELIEHLSK